MDEAPSNPTPKVEAPLGTFSAKVDEKGRLKLPAAFKEYICGFGDNRVFVTSVDNRTLRLYPISVWKANLEFFKRFKSDPRAAADIAFLANANGAGAEVDDQGRVLLPQETRRRLGLENQTVWLDCYNNRINIVGKEVYEERLRAALSGLEDKLLTLEREGFE